MISFKRKTNRPSPHIQLRFLEQLSYLLANGYSLLRALEVLSWEKSFQRIAEKVQGLLKSGKYVDEAFQTLQFDHSITSYLYFVRLHGDLSKHISSCARMYERKSNYEKTFKRAVRYPLFLCVFFIFLFISIKQFVLPSFDRMLQSNGTSTAAHTILQIINGSFYIGGGSLFIVLTLFIFWKIKKKALSISTQMTFYEKIPFYRLYVRLNTSHQLATHMSTLFESGLTIKEILLYLQNQTKLPVLSHYALHLQEKLHAGVPLSDLFDDLYFVEPHLGQIFQTNKDQRSLEKDLHVYAQIVTDELHRKSMQLITIIQPLFFGIIALFIISMYVALMWPMFQMIQNI